MLLKLDLMQDVERILQSQKVHVGEVVIVVVVLPVQAIAFFVEIATAVFVFFRGVRC
jgi:hypothetical protein